MSNIRETAIDRVKGDGFCSVYSTERKYINRLLEMQKEYPDDVTLKVYMDSENPDTIEGIQARVPYDWFKFVAPKRKGRELTEEERIEAAERMKKAREAKKNM